MSKVKNNSDHSSDEESKAIIRTLDEEESIRSLNLETNFMSENIRLQNMSIFTSLKKQTETLDGKLCQSCKKREKETAW